MSQEAPAALKSLAVSRDPAPHGTAQQFADQLRPSIKDKTILITGVSPNSLGASFAEATASAQPAQLILAGRNPSKVQQTVDAIAASHPDVPVRTLKLDLASLPAVRESARELLSWDLPRIDVLVNNAGIMAVDYAVTADGFESQFATNHLGHFLFTNLIMEKLLASEAPRVVNVSSSGHRLSHIRFDDFNFDNGATYDRWTAYGQAKTANMLMALSLAEKLGSKRGLLAFSLHPGTILTNLGNHVDWETGELATADKKLGYKDGWTGFGSFKSLEEGAATTVYAAFDPALQDNNGAYLLDCRLADPWKDTVRPWATNAIEAEKLWKLSEELVGQKFEY